MMSPASGGGFRTGRSGAGTKSAKKRHQRHERHPRRQTRRLGDASGGVGDASRDGPVTFDGASPGAFILRWVTLVTLVTLFCSTVSHRSHKLVRLLLLPRTPPRIPACRRRGKTLVMSAWSCLSLGHPRPWDFSHEDHWSSCLASLSLKPTRPSWGSMKMV
jgi:hypothetical protein